MIDSTFNYGLTPFGNNGISNNSSSNNSSTIGNNKLSMELNRNSITENQTKLSTPIDYKPIMPTATTGLSLTHYNNNNNNNSAASTTATSSSSLYKLNMMSPTTSPCRIQTIHQPHQYPPQPSSTGSASPNSNLSASASPTVFPSPSSYSSSSSSQNDLTSSSTSNGYTWNTYAGLSSRPQFPYAQYASDYYGNMSMTSAAAAGAWFSTQDRLYQAWPAAAAAATTYGFPNLDDIAFQTQLQRRSIRCTCPNCTNEMSGLPPIVGPDERGRKQHICHIPGCERLYGKASHLKTHLRWHTGERPFLCLTCGKRFSRSDELQRHGRTHTNYRPYSCPICAKKFSRSDHLSKHKKTHFKDKKNKKSNTAAAVTATALDKDSNTTGIGNIKKEIINETLGKNNIETLNRTTIRNEEANKNNSSNNNNNNSNNNNNINNKIQDHHQRNSNSLNMNNESTIINNNTNNNILNGISGASLSSSVNHQMNFLKTEPSTTTSSTSHTDIPSGYQPSSAYSMYPPPPSHHQQNIASTTTFFPQSHHHHQQTMSLFYNRNDMQSNTNNLTTSTISNPATTIASINNNSSEQIGNSKLQFPTTSSTNIVGGDGNDLQHNQHNYNASTSTSNSNDITNHQETGTLIHSTGSTSIPVSSSSSSLPLSSAVSYDTALHHQVSSHATNYHHHHHQFKCPDYTTPYADFGQNSMMSSYHHHWPNYHHPQMNY